MTKILIVEDDRFISSAYKMKLVKEQFQVDCAFDGEEALQLAESFSPDLIGAKDYFVKSDISLVELLEKIKKNV